MAVLAAAAHDVQAGAGPAGQALQFFDRAAVIAGQRVVDGLHELAGGLGAGVPGFGAGGFDLLDHAAGREEAVIPGKDDAGEICGLLRGGDQFGEGWTRAVRGLPAQFPPHALDHPQPHDVLEVAGGPAVAALVGKVGGGAGRAGDGDGVLHPQQAPGAAGKADRVFVPGGHGQKGGAGVVGGGQQHGTVETGCLPDRGGKVAEDLPRHADRLEDAPRQTQPGDEFIVPVPAFGPHQRGGGSVGVFVGGHAGQLVVQVIRHHQEGPGRGQLLGMLPLEGGELIGGVEGLVLDAGAGVVLGKGQHRLQAGPFALGPAVPVGHRVAKDAAVFIQQHKVHGPGVDAQCGGDVPGGPAGAQALQHAVP